MYGSIDPRHTVGRIFGSDWTVANVAKLLRFNAGQGVMREGLLTGAERESNEDYLRRTAARNLPSGVTVTFRRDQAGNQHAGLCFAGVDHYLPWSDAWAEVWLTALFQQDRPMVREDAANSGDNPSFRQFTLPR